MTRLPYPDAALQHAITGASFVPCFGGMAWRNDSVMHQCRLSIATGGYVYAPLPRKTGAAPIAWRSIARPLYNRACLDGAIYPGVMSAATHSSGRHASRN